MSVTKLHKDKDTDMTQNNAEKQKALDAALSQIERAFGKGSIMKLNDGANSMNVESVSTGSLGLDIGLGIGGLPRGRIIEIYGPESSGKTTLALQITAECQKAGGVCAFIDAEHALDVVYAKNLERANIKVNFATSEGVKFIAPILIHLKNEHYKFV